MAGKIIADTIEASGSQISLNVGNVTILTASSSGLSSANLNFTGTGNRITGDFSNATRTSRVSFQSSTTNGATVVQLIPNGTSPSAQFSAYGGSDVDNTSVGQLTNNGTEVRVASGIFGTGTYLPMTFYIGGSERVRIDTSGNFFIGTSSNFSADKLCLNFTSLQNGIGIRDDSNSSGAYYAVFRNSANGVIGSITRVTTTNAVTYNTTSDQRLKSNIADASPVLNKLMTVKVRQFDWTEGNLHQDAGFIAQELAPILSGIVTEGRTEDDLWQLDYARLTPYLVKAIQELKAIVDAQAVEIAALKAK